MRMILCLLFSSLLVKASVAQEVIYYDSFFKTVSDIETEYVRKFKIRDTAVQVTQTKHDSLMLSGTVYGSRKVREVNELTQFVRGNGNPYYYKDAFVRMKGNFTFYNNQGKAFRMMTSRNGKVFHAQVWTSAGDPLLVNGNGIRKHNDGKQNEDQYEKYVDSVLVESYTIRHLQQDTLYDTVDKMAEPVGGYQTFMGDLVDILKYPGFAQLAGKQGVVYIQFIVDKNGKFTELKPLTNEGFNFEKRAVKKLSQLPDWTPGLFKGKKVKMKFVLPIKFKLT